MKEHLSRTRLLLKSRVKADHSHTEAAVQTRALRIEKLNSLEPSFLISGDLVSSSANRKARHTKKKKRKCALAVFTCLREKGILSNGMLSRERFWGSSCFRMIIKFQ